MIFIEGTAATAEAFMSIWGVRRAPVGNYSGAGIGLGTDGDAVNLFDAAGTRFTGVTFGASTTFFTFDNVAGRAARSRAERRRRNGAYCGDGATGSPGPDRGARVSACGAGDRRRPHR